MEEIDKGRREKQAMRDRNNKDHNLPTKKIHQRAEGMVEIKESRRQIAIAKAAENKKYQEVRAEYLAKVHELALKDKQAAKKYKEQFGATIEEREAYLRDKAKQEYEKDVIQKANAVLNRHQKLKEEQTERLEEERQNKGVIPFGSSKSEVIVTKTDNQLLAQAKLEIEAEWNAGLHPDAVKQLENIVVTATKSAKKFQKTEMIGGKKKFVTASAPKTGEMLRRDFVYENAKKRREEQVVKELAFTRTKEDTFKPKTITYRPNATG